MQMHGTQVRSPYCQKEFDLDVETEYGCGNTH